MNTKKLNNTSAIKSKFESLFKKTEEEKIEHRAQMLSFIFLSEAEKLMEETGINRKDLANKIGTSPSYLTQLFRGDRMLNFKTIAKIENALGMEYTIKDKHRSEKKHTTFLYSLSTKTKLNYSEVNSEIEHTELSAA